MSDNNEDPPANAADDDDDASTIEEERQRRAEEEEERRAAAALLKQRQDKLKLGKPLSVFTGGGKGPNPFTATPEDPYNNRGVKKPNNYVSSELSVSKQALAVSAAINGVITKQENITNTALQTVVREFSPLMQVNNRDQVRILLNYTFSKKALAELDTYTKLANLQGLFHIEYTPATTETRPRARFEVFDLSVERFIDLIEGHIAPQTESSKAEQTQLPVKMQVFAAAQSMAKQLYDLSLNSLATVAGTMETIVKLNSPLTSNRTLEDYVKTPEGSYVMTEELAKAIKAAGNGSTVPAHVKTRYQWLMQRIPALNGAIVRVPFEEFQEDLIEVFQGLGDAWLHIKGLLRPDQISAINMAPDELRRRLQVRDDTLKKISESGHKAGNNAKRDHASSSSSSSSSSASYADMVKGSDAPDSSKGEKDRESKKKKTKTEHNSDKKAETVNTDLLPLCNACGNKHKYHADPGFKCPYLKHDHPQANKDEPSKAWADSKAGKAFKKRSNLDRLKYAMYYASDSATELTDFEPMVKKTVTFKGSK